jgi:hypothetical protein
VQTVTTIDPAAILTAAATVIQAATGLALGLAALWGRRRRGPRPPRPVS